MWLHYHPLVRKKPVSWLAVLLRAARSTSLYIDLYTKWGACLSKMCVCVCVWHAALFTAAVKDTSPQPVCSLHSPDPAINSLQCFCSPHFQRYLPYSWSGDGERHKKQQRNMKKWENDITPMMWIKSVVETYGFRGHFLNILNLIKVIWSTNLIERAQNTQWHTAWNKMISALFFFLSLHSLNMWWWEHQFLYFKLLWRYVIYFPGSVSLLFLFVSQLSLCFICRTPVVFPPF